MNGMDEWQRMENARLSAQTPYPSPETVVAEALADSSPPNGVRKKANQITRALRDAGWRILR